LAGTSRSKQGQTAQRRWRRSRFLSDFENLSRAGETTKGSYSGPGWPEWLLCVAATTLIALGILTFRSAADPQTADRYYFEQGWVTPLHATAIVLDVAILVATAIGIFLSRRRVKTESLLAALAYIGILLAWSEILIAVRSQPTELYRLTQLPYRPMNNSGLLGAQVFASYLVFKLPPGRLGGWSNFWIRFAIALGVLVAQLLIFDTLAKT